MLCEYAAPLLRPGGVLVAWKGHVDETEAADARAAAAHLGLAPERVLPVTPYPGSSQRTLHIVRKVGPTPAAISAPARPGDQAAAGGAPFHVKRRAASAGPASPSTAGGQASSGATTRWRSGSVPSE